jgi:hypothetical protein
LPAGITHICRSSSQPSTTRQCEELVQALRHGSAASWRHVNLLGEYNFFAERLKDFVGIKSSKMIV